MTDKAISPLRRRLIRRLSPKTHYQYTCSDSKFLNDCWRSSFHTASGTKSGSRREG